MKVLVKALILKPWHLVEIQHNQKFQNFGIQSTQNMKIKSCENCQKQGNLKGK